ncbi:hypothetical protein AG1IA_05748 [Rhizoctonia solani AG-1 IA]|uniref:Uncharacterized protein n=1 Tax=Thanatephorus cucumeris (strain AG1-IA) TaxID=983506 RepID=L8WV66_THACA|nr:hypothetical protein AG1IA_05748 [Rhizoctonia solani AG-1 IA]
MKGYPRKRPARAPHISNLVGQCQKCVLRVWYLRAINLVRSASLKKYTISTSGLVLVAINCWNKKKRTRMERYSSEWKEQEHGYNYHLWARY